MLLGVVHEDVARAEHHDALAGDPGVIAERKAKRQPPDAAEGEEQQRRKQKAVGDARFGLDAAKLEGYRKPG